MQSLAIIVPAYKRLFLRETLESIARQTDKNFTLYVGDDCSPEDLESVCAEFAGDIDLKYIRYGENFGGRDLASHWERCIDASCEPYIWLFSDDDTMPADAVERINRAVRGTHCDFFRLPLDVTGPKLDIAFKSSGFHSSSDAATTFLNEKFSGKRPSAAIEFIFSRSLYERSGKFVHFPVAWASDDATWFRFALLGGGIVNLPGESVCWRQSEGANISTNTALDREKMRATTLFVQWLRCEMESWDIPCSKEFLRNLKKYIRTILTVSVGGHFSAAELVRLCRALAAFDRKLAFKIFVKYFI